MSVHNEASSYEKNVFINCPFDNHYNQESGLFWAITFTVLDCGFKPRCSLERKGAHVRLDYIIEIIRESKFGIHDISRTQLDKENALPRFNMPLELGIFLGAIRLGGSDHQTKSYIVLDTERYRYQKFMSDLNGVDVYPHDNKPEQLIIGVRDWLSDHTEKLPTGDAIVERFIQFCSSIDLVCLKIAEKENIKLNHKHLTFRDLVYVISWWLSTPDG